MLGCESKRRLYSDTLSFFDLKAHQDIFRILLDLFLEAKGRPLPTQAVVKSPAALSRLLNHYGWNIKTLVRALRQHAQQVLLDFWHSAPHQRLRLELLVDLTSLNKTGDFPLLDGWMHAYNGVHGVQLVVLPLCCGPLKLPWAVQIWRGKGTPAPPLLALKLLQTVPASLLRGARRLCVHADGGFECATFMHGVLDRGLDLVVGVRKSRALADGRKVADLTARGTCATARGLRQAMTISWVWLYRNAEPEQRFVMSNRTLGGVHLARVGKRRWKVEAFFKTILGRFGLERFAQSRKQGAFRFWCFSALAFLLCHLADLDLPPKAPGEWPDWGERACDVRLTLLADVRRAVLLRELAQLDAVQDALLAASP